MLVFVLLTSCEKVPIFNFIGQKEYSSEDFIIEAPLAQIKRVGSVYGTPGAGLVWEIVRTEFYSHTNLDPAFVSSPGLKSKIGNKIYLRTEISYEFILQRCIEKQITMVISLVSA